MLRCLVAFLSSLFYYSRHLDLLCHFIIIITSFYYGFIPLSHCGFEWFIPRLHVLPANVPFLQSWRVLAVFPFDRHAQLASAPLVLHSMLPCPKVPSWHSAQNTASVDAFEPL